MWAMRLHGSDEFLGWAILKTIRDTSHVEVGLSHAAIESGAKATPPRRRAPCSTTVSTNVGLEEITAVTHPDNAASQHAHQMRPQARRHA